MSMNFLSIEIQDVKFIHPKEKSLSSEVKEVRDGSADAHNKIMENDEVKIILDKDHVHS